MKTVFKKILLAAFTSPLALILLFTLLIYLDGPHPPILMYHHIQPEGGNSSKLVVDLAYFEKQMAFLKEEKYQILPLDRFFSFILEKKSFPKKAVAITFDDGYEDNYTYAYPILKKFDFPATVFLIVGKIGTEGYLNWNQISEMAAHNIRFGNHTLTHPNLTEITQREIRREISTAQSILMKRLRFPSPLFAYPSGFYNEAAQSEVKRLNYMAAVSASMTEDLSLNERYGFKRVRITNSSKDMPVFWLSVSGYQPALKKLKYRLRKFKRLFKER